MYAAWIEGEPRLEYLKIRPRRYAMGMGEVLDVQREGESQWRPARRIEGRANGLGLGSIIWLTLDADPPTSESDVRYDW